MNDFLIGAGLICLAVSAWMVHPAAGLGTIGAALTAVGFGRYYRTKNEVKKK